MKLEAAQSRRPPLPEIVLWIAASRSPSESQTSECSDLLSRSRATFLIVAQRQPGKLHCFTIHATKGLLAGQSGKISACRHHEARGNPFIGKRQFAPSKAASNAIPAQY